LRYVAIEVTRLRVEVDQKPHFDARAGQRDLDIVLGCERECFREVVMIVDVTNDSILVECVASPTLGLAHVSGLSSNGVLHQ
jgi:hypothetical protein